MKPERVGADQDGCELFVLDVSRLDQVPDDLAIGSRYFLCLLALDARGVGDDQVIRAAERLLRQGAVFVCSWGPDCERVHDLVDQVDAGLNPNATDDSVVLTTWHSDEPLDEALWFLLNAASPAEDYVKECRAALIITMGSPAWSSAARSALAPPPPDAEND
jgi:hypothetical protein